jgi:aryl-alcohol dehydrogenase-like predicted oxidoreductase
MIAQTTLGGAFTLPATSITLNRMGYGAMKLAGPQVWGPPADADGAVSILREAVARGVNHIDTSDYYGPHVTNQIIKQALHPYPDGLRSSPSWALGADRTSPGLMLFHARS